MADPRMPAYVRPATPREVALAILEPRFGCGGAADHRDGRTFHLADFQEDAVARARSILRRRRGVIIADGVGLGKTYIGLALAEEQIRRSGRVCVISPAALGPDWRRPLARLCRRARASALGLGETSRPGPDGTSGSGPDGTSGSGPDGGGERRLGGTGGRLPVGPMPRSVGGLLAWVSQARLSRGTHRPDRLLPLDLVIVDEAHAFRTPSTRRYRALAELCRQAHVVLLTATPVNNSLWDLYHLLRLFSGDGSFCDIGVADLEGSFRESVAAASTGTPELLGVLRETVVRRSRAFVRTQYDGVQLPGTNGPTLDFPARAAPRPVRYALDGAYGGSLNRLLDDLDRLTLAPYRLVEYGDRTQPGLAAGAYLLKLGLVRRLESSVAALRRSIARQLRVYEGFVAALARGRLVASPGQRALYSPAGDQETVQLVLEEMVLERATELLQSRRLLADARADLERLRSVHRGLRPTESAADPKLTALRHLLDGELRGCSVIVFTEFRDTARYLWRSLLPRGRIGLVDGGGAFAGAMPATRRAVIRRFSPRANGVRPPPERERVDVLIATDVLAEGLNLQDASTVISYDLPWNPVRLIQRAGRVDRLRPADPGSDAAEVYTYHFVPEAGLESVLGIVSKLRTKLAAIRGSVGTDQPVLGFPEEAWADCGPMLERIASADPTIWDDADAAEAGVFASDDRLHAAYRRALAVSRRMQAAAGRTEAKRSDGGTWRDGGPISHDSHAGLPPAAAFEGAKHSLLVGCRLGHDVACVVVDPVNGAVSRDENAASELLLRAISADAAKLTPSWTSVARAIESVRSHLQKNQADLNRFNGIPFTRPAARAARALMRGCARFGMRHDPDLCRRVDQMLERLAAPHTAGTEAALRAELRNPIRPVDDLLCALEAVFGIPPDSAERTGIEAAVQESDTKSTAGGDGMPTPANAAATANPAESANSVDAANAAATANPAESANSNAPAYPEILGVLEIHPPAASRGRAVGVGSNDADRERRLRRGSDLRYGAGVGGSVCAACIVAAGASSAEALHAV